MPSIRLSNVGVVANALDGLKFQEIPQPGALVTIYATTAIAGGTIDYGIGSETFLDGASVNIEAGADLVQTERDKVLDREPVPPGKQFLKVIGQIANLLIVVEELP